MESYKTPLDNKVKLFLIILSTVISLVGLHTLKITLLYDLYSKLFHNIESEESNKVYVVEISNEDLNFFKEYPLNRTHYIRALENIKGSSVIGIDILYSGYTDIDDIFGQVIKEKGNVVLSKTFLDDVLPSFYKEAAGVGNTFVPYNSHSGRFVTEFPDSSNSFSQVVSILYELNGYGYIDNHMDYVSWTSNIISIPFRKLVQAPIDFKGGVVLIGYTATSIGDVFRTPVSESIPGIYIHANYVYNSINNIGIHKINLNLYLLIFITLIFVYLPIYITFPTCLIILTYLFSKYYYLPIEIIFISNFLYIIFKLSFLLISNFKSLKKAILTDELTQIFNKRAFNLIARDRWNSFNYVVLVVIDIDNFKKYNDNYGHQMGDKILSQVGLSLKEFSKKRKGFAFRVGGEEFIYLKEYKVKPSLNDVKSLLKELNELIYGLKLEHKFNNDIGYISISIGAVGINALKYDIDYAFNVSDKNLYIAKNQGRNRHQYTLIY